MNYFNQLPDRFIYLQYSLGLCGGGGGEVVDVRNSSRATRSSWVLLIE